MAKCKILATVGPASSSPEVLASLAVAGVSVFRVNASHLSPEGVASQVVGIRAAVPGACVLVDLQGPKMRIGELSAPMELVAGESVVVGPGGLPVSFDMRDAGVVIGDRVLFFDGRVECVAVAWVEGGLECRVARGGLVSSRKGVNLPDTLVSFPALTDADRGVLSAVVGLDVDWVALSFVQTAADMLALRELVPASTGIMAKIERSAALVDLDAIAAVSDALLVARGDLGVELPFEDLPVVQQLILDRGRAAQVPVVCATEMLESMVLSSRPTRAEVTDVAHAVGAGFDAVMLSAETAVGVDPCAAVAAMARVRDRVESSGVVAGVSDGGVVSSSLAVARAAQQLASDTGASAVLALTASGHTARMLSSCRPSVPVVAVTPSASVARRLMLLWGVEPLVSPRPSRIDEAADAAAGCAVAKGLVSYGDKVVVCGSRVGPTADADAIWVQTI
jgi:pyruvate kinase